MMKEKKQIFNTEFCHKIPLTNQAHPLAAIQVIKKID